MDHLPQNPAILVSSVNMLLRDEEFDSLETLCYAYDQEPEQLKDYLFANGFVCIIAKTNCTFSKNENYIFLTLFHTKMSSGFSPLLIFYNRAFFGCLVLKKKDTLQ